MRQVRVYFAGKLANAEEVIKIERANPQILFTNRWQYMEGKCPDSAEEAFRFWQLDEADVRLADIVLVWALTGQKLRGALVEVGIGIASGATIFVVGDHPDFGTWQYHPAVHRFSSMGAALSMARIFNK